ncbi:MAG: oligosaccharide flippase family protein [Planctomycetota bacterium]
MRQSTKLVVNSAVSFMRSVGTMALALVAMRIVYRELAGGDFGIFQSVGAATALMALLTTALTDASSRHMAHAIGEKDTERVARVFNTNLLMYGTISLVIVLGGLVLAGPVIAWLGDKIPAGRESDAEMVFRISAVTVATLALTTSFTSVANAHQKIYLVAPLEIAGSLLRLAGAFALLVSPISQLLTWTLVVLGSQLAVLLLTAGVVMRTFEVARIRPSLFRRSMVGELLSYGGWVVLSTISWQLRVQAATLMMAKLVGLVVVEAYRIAMTLGGVQNSVALTLNTAASPAVVTHHGAGQSGTVRSLVLTASKFSAYASALAAIPLVFETRTLLELWLGADAPGLDTIAPLTRVASVWLLLQSMGHGYVFAINATGKIGPFTLATVAIDASALAGSGAVLWWATAEAPPLGPEAALAARAILVHLGETPAIVVPALALLSMVAHLIMRAVYVGGKIGLAKREFLAKSLLPAGLCLGAGSLAAWGVTGLMEPGLVRVIASTAAAYAGLGLSVWTVGLSAEERGHLVRLGRGLAVKIIPGRRAASGEDQRSEAAP